MEIIHDNGSTQRSSFLLPPHKDRLVLSILCKLFCCQIGGIVAIIYAAKSNSSYRGAMVSQDDSARQALYYQSEAEGKTSKTWIIVSICTGLAGVITYIALVTLGVIASLW